VLKISALLLMLMGVEQNVNALYAAIYVSNNTVYLTADFKSSPNSASSPAKTIFKNLIKTRNVGYLNDLDR